MIANTPAVKVLRALGWFLFDCLVIPLHALPWRRFLEDISRFQRVGNFRKRLVDKVRPCQCFSVQFVIAREAVWVPNQLGLPVSLFQLRIRERRREFQELECFYNCHDGGELLSGIKRQVNYHAAPYGAGKNGGIHRKTGSPVIRRVSRAKRYG